MKVERFVSALFLAFSVLACNAQIAGRYYRIVSGTQSVFPQDASSSASRVVLWTETGVAAQRWQLVDFGDGQYGFRNAYSGLYLARENGNKAGQPVSQRPLKDAGDYAKWSVQPVEGVEGAYKLFTDNTNKYCLSKNIAQGDGVKLSTIYEPTTAAERTQFYLVEDAACQTSFTAAVRDSMMNGFLNQYYHTAANGHVLGNGGWWGDAEMFETILDAFETTGDARYREIFSELYKNFLQRNGTDWSNNEFNDDITWMVLACVRAYKFFGVQDYLDKARKNYDAMYNRAHQRFGTLVWKQSQENKLATNSCINCPATVAACYLAEATGDEAYYGKALSIYKAQRQLLFDASNGQVYDSRAWTSDGSMEANFNHWASTYNQGTMLGAAILLYEYTGDAQYLTDADKIYNYTISHLCNGDSIINVCQTISGDLCGFKGIFMRYARRYAQDLNHEEAFSWMGKNAWKAWQNRNSKGVTWSAWLTKTSEDFKRKEGNDEKDITNDAFGASTAVSVAFNAHVNSMFSKNAFSTNPATCFDDLKFMQLSEEDGGTCAVLNLPHGYAGFRRVDFGDSGAQDVVLRVNATQSRTKLIVYADSVVADRRLGDTGVITKGQWQNKTIKLSERLTGKHTIYFVTTVAGAKLHNFRFFADAAGISSAFCSDRPGKVGIYGMNGMRVSPGVDVKALPKGLYVVCNGRDGVAKVILHR